MWAGHRYFYMYKYKYIVWLKDTIERYMKHTDDAVIITIINTRRQMVERYMKHTDDAVIITIINTRRQMMVEL